MIKAQDLRIGNILQHGEWADVLKVESIHNDFINDPLLNYNFYNGKLQGIPFTEELLLKCGFEKRHPVFKLQIGSNVDFALVYCYLINRWELSVGNDIVFDDWDFKYLHQLQNLIFTLTGTELQINL